MNKTVGILAYCTPIGFIIGLIMNQNRVGEEKGFGAFHMRQALGLFVASIALSVIITFLILVNVRFVYLNDILSLSVLIFAIMGIINANKGEKKNLPIIGDYIEKNFGDLFE